MYGTSSTYFGWLKNIFPKTDGLADNVFPSEIVALCSLVGRRGGSEDEQVQAIADGLVDYARQCMLKKNRVSPFERGSLPHYAVVFPWCIIFVGEAARQAMFFRGGVRKAFFVWRLLCLNWASTETRRVCEFNTTEYSVVLTCLKRHSCGWPRPRDSIVNVIYPFP